MKNLKLSKLLFTGLIAVGSVAGLTPAHAEPLYGKCTITISKMGTQDITTCTSQPIPSRCISESPDEPQSCSPTGKIKLKNGGVSISANYINNFVEAWVDAGDGAATLAKVPEQTVRFPYALTMLVPVRGVDQLGTGERAYINCSVFSTAGVEKDCP